MAFEWELFRNGLAVVGTGMGVVFLVLLLLMGVIFVASRLDSLPRLWGSSRGSDVMQQPEETPSDGAAEPSIPAEVVAAITVGLRYAFRTSDSGAGHGISEPQRIAPADRGAGPSAWVISGRRRVLENSSRRRR